MMEEKKEIYRFAGMAEMILCLMLDFALALSMLLSLVVCITLYMHSMDGIKANDLLAHYDQSYDIEEAMWHVWFGFNFFMMVTISLHRIFTV